MYEVSAANIRVVKTLTSLDLQYWQLHVSYIERTSCSKNVFHIMVYCDNTVGTIMLISLIFAKASNVEDTAVMSKHRLKRYITPTISKNTQLT